MSLQGVLRREEEAKSYAFTLLTGTRKIDLGDEEVDY